MAFFPVSSHQLLIRTLVKPDFRPTSLHDDLVLLFLQWPVFPNKMIFGGPGVRTPTYLFGGPNSTHNDYIGQLRYLGGPDSAGGLSAGWYWYSSSVFLWHLLLPVCRGPVSTTCLLRYTVISTLFGFPVRLWCLEGTGNLLPGILRAWYQTCHTGFTRQMLVE